MSMLESLLIASFCILIVFSVLISLFVIIRIFSSIVKALEKKNKTNSNLQQALINEDLNLEVEEEIFSSGTLKLKNVDEPTAAMIMAIVSDESGISLSELCFKSIRLVEKS